MSKLSEDIRRGVELLPDKRKVTHCFFSTIDCDMQVTGGCVLGAALVGHYKDRKLVSDRTTALLGRTYSFIEGRVKFSKEDRKLIVDALRQMNYTASANHWEYDMDGDTVRLFDLIEALNDHTNLSILEIADRLEKMGF